MLQLNQIKKTYKNNSFSVSVPKFQLKQGELFALVGPSGCGKTTLLKMIAGLLSPDQGEVSWEDRTITDLPPEKRNFSMVFQQPLLFPHLNVIENVSFGLVMMGMKKHHAAKKASEMLTAVDLNGLENRLPAELSGGQQQRVAIARALVMKPSLLLMDEPFSALDPDLRQTMRELMLHLHQSYQVTTVFVTHDQEEAFFLADRIGVMKEGELRQVGSPQQLYEHPESIEVASFLGIKNQLWGEFDEGMFRSEGFHLPLPPNGREVKGTGWLILRPEMLQVSPRSSSISKMYPLEGKLVKVKYIQGIYQLRVEVGSNFLEVTQPKQTNWLPEHGELVTIHVPLKELHWILSN